MALRNKIFLACESLLRVPPLLVIDEIFRYNFGLSDKWTPEEGGVMWLLPNNDPNPTPARAPEVPVLPFQPLSESHGLSTFLFSLWSYLGRAVESTVLNDTLPSPSGSSDSFTTTTTDSAHYMNLEIGGFDDAESRIGDLVKVFKVIVLLQRKSFHISFALEL